MQKVKISTRIAFILLSLLPLGVGCILQFIASLICMIFGGIFQYLSPDANNGMTNFYDFLQSNQFTTWVMLIYALLAVLLIGVWYHIAVMPKRMPRRTTAQLINPSMAVALVLLAAALQFLCNYFVMLIAYMKPGWYDTYNNLFKTAGMDHKTPLLILYTVIAAPICEELIFRGVTLHFASKALPFWIANILQAALFGLYHMNLMQGIYAFLIGLLCGVVYHYGQSIYLSIAFHMLFNAWGTFLDNFMYYGDNLLLHLLQFLISVLIAVIGICLYKRGARLRPPFFGGARLNRQ